VIFSDLCVWFVLRVPQQPQANGPVPTAPILISPATTSSLIVRRLALPRHAQNGDILYPAPERAARQIANSVGVRTRTMPPAMCFARRTAPLASHASGPAGPALTWDRRQRALKIETDPARKDSAPPEVPLRQDRGQGGGGLRHVAWKLPSAVWRQRRPAHRHRGTGCADPTAPRARGEHQPAATQSYHDQHETTRLISGRTACRTRTRRVPPTEVTSHRSAPGQAERQLHQLTLLLTNPAYAHP